MKFKSDIEVQAGLRDSSGSTGASGQILSSNGNTVSWVPAGSSVASDVQNEVKAGVAINKGQAVYVTSADGTNIIVGLASNTTEATSSKTLGLLNATVAINGFADVVQIGRLAGLNTLAATVGDPVWLGSNGNLIYGLINKPYAPLHLVFIGIVTRVNANNGEIFVNVQNGFELNEIHDVDLKTNVPINGDILGYNGTLWVNKTIAGWLGYTPADQAITISTTAPLSGGGNLSANRTLSIAQANATTNGYLSSTDWNTFNNKQSALTFTSPLVNTSSTVSITLATTSTNGYLSSADWNTFNSKQTALNGTGFVKASGTTISYDNSTYTPTSRTITINGVTQDLSANQTWTIASGVTSFNTRTGAVTLTSGDVTTALGYTPVTDARTITINGVTQDLTANRSWTVSAPETDTLATVTARGALSTGNMFTPVNGGLFFNGNGLYNTGVYGNGNDLWFNAGSTQKAALNSSGDFTANNSLRSPIFYDSNNTGYYGDFASTSKLNNLQVATLDSAITWTNNTYMMGSPTHGFRFNDNGSNINALIIDNSGNTFAYASHRAPIFYDSNDTTYYSDLSSTSQSATRQRGGSLYGPNTSWGAYLLVGGNGRTSYIDNTLVASVCATDGNIHLDAASGKNMYLNYYDGANIYIGNGAESIVGTISNSGVFQINDSFRAPIFYDSNNTGYYADFSSTGTSINIAGSLNASTFNKPAILVNSSGTGSAGSAIGMQQVTAEGWTGIFVDFEPNTGWGFYHDNPSNYFLITAETTDGNIGSNVVPSRSSGNRTAYTKFQFQQTDGIGIAGGSWRAPIFYDYNNTGYYVDPASTSKLNTLTLSALASDDGMIENNTGGYFHLGGWGVGRTAPTAILVNTAYRSDYADDAVVSNYSRMDYLMSLRDFPNGTLIQTSIDYSVTNGDPFVLEIKGNSYGNIIPMDIQIQGYIYANTIINTGGYSNGFNVTGIRAINYNGYLCFWFPSQGYWNGYTVKVYRAYDGRQANAVTSITNSGLPTTAKQVDFAPVISLRSDNYSGYSSFSGAVYGTIFYDSNNTGYYVDPSNTSNVNTVIVNALLSVAGSGGNYNEGIRLTSGTGSWSNIQFGANTSGAGTQANQWIVGKMPSGNFVMSLAGNQDSGSRFLIDQGGGLQSPIYYDGNNTGYYVDPSNISNLFEANFGDNSNGNQGINIYYGNQNGGYGKIRFYQSGSNHQTIHSFSANWQGGGFGSGNSANAINIDGAAGVTFGGWNVPDAYIAKGGNFWCRYDVIAYSDARVKDNVEVITNALDKIKKVRGVTFTRNDYEDKEKRHTGVIAQEMLEALPEAVTKDSDGMYSVSYGNLAGLFIEAIKEQQTQIEELKELVNKLINK